LVSGPEKDESAPAQKAEPAAAIFARAEERKLLMGLPYAGAVTPAEAWALQGLEAARILDVRTQPEWQVVGHVPEVPLIEWPREGEDNALRAFLAQVEREFDKERPLLFLCRSGVRSHHAAELATQAGFARSYNVLEGFEGNAPGKGWRAAGLPWKKG
jgi:rhodanese-related sulfurtransferase